MAGIFATWQSVYEEAGIATFPVNPERKAPAVGNYLRAGMPASRGWANKFADATALGFACGKRNRLTVLDIDTPDERVLADAMTKLGPSPVVIRTASGKFHAWYRHNGESRSVRKLAAQIGLTGPVDILGNGFAVAPPSEVSAGRYEFVQGSLADIGSLPVLGLPEAVPRRTESVPVGQRNDTLFRACLTVAPECGSFDDVLAHAIALNTGALPADEVARTAQSAWRIHCEGRNGLAGDRFVQIGVDVLDRLEAYPDAAYLYTLLRRRHWGREFYIANGWAAELPCGGWPLRRFRAARDFLITSGLIQCVRAACKENGPAVYRFTAPAARSRGRQGGGV